MLRLLAVVSLVLTATGCDSGATDSQRQFEDTALLSPVQGITRTTDRGAVLSRDSTDWRIGPVYTNRVSFLDLPYPNPISRSRDGVLSLVLNIVSPLAGGLSVKVLYENPRTGALDFLSLAGGRCTNATAATICPFSISPTQIDYRNTGGLYRLVLLDDRGIVSYGDVEVTP